MNVRRKWRYLVLAAAGSLVWALSAGLPAAHAAGPAGPAGTGALVSVVGLSTGPCSVMGCGAPVMPVVGLAFAGLSSTTVAALSQLSSVVGVGLIVVLAVAVGGLGWAVGGRERARGYNRA